MDKGSLLKNFSRAASFYDQYADIQKISALELLNRIPPKDLRKILEIGCGTGNYTLLLREKFKEAQLKALDISSKMVEVAKDKLKGKEIEFLVDDGEEVRQDESFDLITSNACFQWFESLEKALIKYKSMLSKNGILAFSFFGPQTFWELDCVLKKNVEDSSIAAGCFIPKEQIKDLIERHFKNIRIEEMKYEERFSHLADLLRKIKYTGTAGESLGPKRFFGPQQLKTLETAYRNQFQEICATYQVFFCQGELKA